MDTWGWIWAVAGFSAGFAGFYIIFGRSTPGERRKRRPFVYGIIGLIFLGIGFFNLIAGQVPFATSLMLFGVTCLMFAETHWSTNELRKKPDDELVSVKSQDDQGSFLKKK